MILRAIKLAVLVAFFVQLTRCDFKEVSESRMELMKDVNDSFEYPNLIVQQKEREGVWREFQVIFD
jgi:hypothetical protein